MVEKNKKRDIEKKTYSNRDNVYCFLVAAMLLSVLAVALFLAFYGSRYSYYSQRDYSQRIALVPDRIWLQLLCFLLVGGVALLLNFLFSSLSEQIQKRIALGMLLFCCVWILVVWSLYVWKNPYFPVGDQRNTTAASFYVRQGNYEMFSPGGYIGLYQQQKGLVLIYELLYSIFGDFCYDEAKQIHVLFGIGALVAGYHFLKLHTQKIFPRILFCAFFILCIPFMMYMPYIYGDIPAISLSVILFWALSAFEKNGKKRYLFVAMVVAALALLFRMTSWIVLIAVTIGLLLTAWKRWNWKPVLAAFLLLVTSVASVKAVDAMYEYRSGYESGIGIPGILWIAMGLQETNGAPGIYNRYQQSVFADHNFEKEPAVEEGKQYIKERLREFSGDCRQAIDFFKRKLQMQWLEPLFEGLYSTSTFENERDIPEWIEELYYGGLHDTVWIFADYYQSVVYLSLLTFVACALADKRKTQINGTFWIPLIAVAGGFLFSVIWESQCRYVLPYYVFMLLYVPMGLEIPAGLLQAHR